MRYPFFGKPVANSTVEVTASTFDVAFKKFTVWKGKTDANGHVKFEIQLPDRASVAHIRCPQRQEHLLQTVVEFVQPHGTFLVREFR